MTAQAEGEKKVERWWLGLSARVKEKCGKQCIYAAQGAGAAKKLRHEN
jgi:hypothetical protein